MDSVVTLAQYLRHEPPEALRTLIVCGCALALIAARYPLPF